ncbi:hypothetical protein MASR2M39_20180 [Ignavibacteriales bacterium]|jgi:photosystem II stability/assembly factor-like uncharacterized protein
MKTLFVIVLLLGISIYGQNHDFPEGTNLTTVASISSQKVLVAGPGGFIKISDNRGDTWRDITWVQTFNFLDADFSSSTTGILLASGGKIYKTINGGENWETVLDSPTDPFIKVTALSDSEYVALTSSNYYRYTTNGGLVWNTSGSVTTGNFHAGCVKSVNEVYALTGNKLVSTTDAFQTYTVRQTVEEPLGPQVFNVVYFSDPLNGVISRNAGAGVRTTDGGVTWTVTSYPPFYFPNIKGIAGKGNRVMVVGEYSLVLKTSNIGASWNIYSPDPYAPVLSDVDFYNDDVWYAVSVNNHFQRTTDFGANWTIKSAVVGVGDKNPIMPQDLILYNNYPNPFSIDSPSGKFSTAIRFEIPKTTRLLGKVYDLLGKEIKTLVDGEFSAGKHQINFSIEGISSGVYIFRLEGGGSSKAIKMVIAR